MRRMKTQKPSRTGVRLCAVAAFGGLAIGAVGIAAPASATVALPETGSAPISLLGWSERTTGSHDEWRADFTVRVPHGMAPTKIEWNYAPYKTDAWTTLSKVAAAQASVGDAYSIVQTVADGNTDVLYISARGDSSVPVVKDSIVYNLGLRVTMADGTTTTRMAYENVGRNAATGRPAPVQAWDSTTAGLPGYTGPNSQVGWGNYVAPGSNETLVGAKFHVDSLNSGRSAANGCDVTDSIYYQFVRGDNAQPASITPTPRQVSIKDHSSGVKGALLAELGRFSLDDAGYYKLLVWPQASSSKVTAPQECSAVSYNPAVLSEATQVGSVFWKVPTTATPAAPTPIVPVSVTSPGVDEVVATTTPTYSGVGHPGAYVEVRSASGLLHGFTFVDDNGEWTIVSGTEHADGAYTATVTQAAPDNLSTAPVSYTVQTAVAPPAPTIAPVALVSPADGEVVTTATPMFSGTGHPGATVVVRGSSGKVLATTTVDVAGNWSVVSAISLGNGGYVGVTEHTFGDSKTTAPVRYSIALGAPAFAGLPFAITSPTVGGAIATTIPVFAGTGSVGATVEVRGNSGRVIASATVDASGKWSATSTLTLTPGLYLGSVSHNDRGTITNNALDYRIAYGVTLANPTDGGTVNGPLPTFSGFGEAGATVIIRGSSGRTVASTTVGADGLWSATADFELAAGRYVGTVAQNIGGVETHTAPITYTVK